MKKLNLLLFATLMLMMATCAFADGIQIIPGRFNPATPGEIGGTTPATGTFTTLSVSGGQVAFPATADPSANSNTMDDYEEGVFTTTLTGSTSGSYTLSNNLLGYVKIGRQVTVQGRIVVSAASSPVGNLQLSLPFTSVDLTNYADQSTGIGTFRDHGGSLNDVVSVVAGATNYAYFVSFDAAGVDTVVTNASVDTAFSLYFSIVYFAE